MHIVNQIGKTLTSGSRSALQKTKDMAEIAKIGGNISDMQKEMEKCYAALGRQLVDRCIEENARLDDPNVKRVMELRAGIAALQEEQNRLKGAASCPNCGSAVSVSAAFCSVCGKPVRAAAPVLQENMVSCPQCGGAVRAGVKFCTHCGFCMSSAPVPERAMPAEPAATAAEPVMPVKPAVTEPEPAAAPVEPVPASAAVSKHCRQCGAENAPEDRFCLQCGNILE